MPGMGGQFRGNTDPATMQRALDIIKANINAHRDLLKQKTAMGTITEDETTSVNQNIGALKQAEKALLSYSQATKQATQSSAGLLEVVQTAGRSAGFGNIINLFGGAGILGMVSAAGVITAQSFRMAMEFNRVAINTVQMLDASGKNLVANYNTFKQAANAGIQYGYSPMVTERAIAAYGMSAGSTVGQTAAAAPVIAQFSRAFGLDPVRAGTQLGGLAQYAGPDTGQTTRLLATYLTETGSLGRRTDEAIGTITQVLQTLQAQTDPVANLRDAMGMVLASTNANNPWFQTTAGVAAATGAQESVMHNISRNAAAVQIARAGGMSYGDIISGEWTPENWRAFMGSFFARSRYSLHRPDLGYNENPMMLAQLQTLAGSQAGGDTLYKMFQMGGGNFTNAQVQEMNQAVLQGKAATAMGTDYGTIMKTYAESEKGMIQVGADAMNKAAAALNFLKPEFTALFDHLDKVMQGMWGLIAILAATRGGGGGGFLGFGGRGGPKGPTVVSTGGKGGILNNVWKWIRGGGGQAVEEDIAGAARKIPRSPVDPEVLAARGGAAGLAETAPALAGGAEVAAAGGFNPISDIVGGLLEAFGIYQLGNAAASWAADPLGQWYGNQFMTSNPNVPQIAGGITSPTTGLRFSRVPQGGGVSNILNGPVRVNQLQGITNLLPPNRRYGQTTGAQINAIAQRHGIPPILLAEVLMKESNFTAEPGDVGPNPDYQGEYQVQSGKFKGQYYHAYGMGQLNEDTPSHHALIMQAGGYDAFMRNTPLQMNVAAAMLAGSMNQNGGDVFGALQDYNGSKEYAVEAMQQMRSFGVNVPGGKLWINVKYDQPGSDAPPPPTRIARGTTQDIPPPTRYSSPATSGRSVVFFG